jgi:hypothetical protein
LVPGRIGEEERPVVPYDPGLDRTRGHVSVDFDDKQRVRVSVHEPGMGICGHAYLSLLEFAKVVCVVKGRVSESERGDLPW